MLRVLKTELMKAQWPLLIGLVIAGPALASILGVPGKMPPGQTKWVFYYGISVIRFAWLFYPLLAGVFAALVCRTEHASGGWKQMLSMPVSRTSVYLAKFAMVAGLLLATGTVFLAMYVAFGSALRFPGPIPWDVLARSLLGGWMAVLPLAALQLWVSTQWKSFGAPLALNICFTLPAIFAANSKSIGPWYPWAQPVLAMMPPTTHINGAGLNVSAATLWIVIIGGFVVTMSCGWLTFLRRDVRG